MNLNPAIQFAQMTTVEKYDPTLRKLSKMRRTPGGSIDTQSSPSPAINLTAGGVNAERNE